MTMNLNAGATAAVLDEVDLIDLPVIGAIPPELGGVLLRNGPNPLRGRFKGNDVSDWWPEDAMLHAPSRSDPSFGQPRVRQAAPVSTGMI